MTIWTLLCTILYTEHLPTNLLAGSQLQTLIKALNYVTEKKPLTAEEHILVFLWFVGHRNNYCDVADVFNITISSLPAVISKVADFFVTMAPEVIRFFTDEEREATVTYFGAANHEKDFHALLVPLMGLV